MAFTNEFITIYDLYSAYRKAKKEAFHDTNSAQGQKFAEFENKIEFNLELLLTKLTSENSSWHQQLEFIGRATCITKGVEVASTPESHFALSDPTKNWKRIHKKVRAKAEFRPVISASVDFQIISALWIMKVGHLLDESLDPRLAVGNRISRWRAPSGSPPGTVGPMNMRGHKLFQPYYHAYGGWRERGLRAMKDELNKGSHIVAVTMDLRKFYHLVDATFLLNPSYLRAAGVTLSRDQRVLTEQLIGAIETWNRDAQKLTGKSQFGLPVGITFSSVIANVLLKEFDTKVQSLEPVYYGRYVDDIFLVLKHKGFKDQIALMRWLASRLGNIASFELSGDTPQVPILKIVLPYGGKSELIFSGKKQKVFQLKGRHGLDLISPIEEQIRKQKSEHRGLPSLPDREAAMAARALLVSSDATLEADALRKADAVTLRRAGFAMLLSAAEQHARNVERKSWKEVRNQFYGLAERHLITPRGFFDFAVYLPRILGVMIECRELNKAHEFVRKLAELIQVVRETCDLEERELQACTHTLAGRLIDGILQARPVASGKVKVLTLLRQIRDKLSPRLKIPTTEARIERRATLLFLADWSVRPYGITWLESHAGSTLAVDRPTKKAVADFFNVSSFRALKAAAKVPQAFHWCALAFPTRPIGISALTAYAPNLMADYQTLAGLIETIRGTWHAPDSNLALSAGHGSVPDTIVIPVEIGGELIIAVTNFKTSDSEWKAAARIKPIHSFARYRRINDFINDILKLSTRPRYILFPECSIPRRWARTIATKLSLAGISLLAGLEYRRGKSGLLNEALISLHSNFIGYPTNVVILQPKLAPAWEEKRQLAEVAKQALDAPVKGSLKVPVYVHGNFCFSLLICSDLTTLKNRSLLQGFIDCLFVPEWNKDLETFNALVESTTNDLHAFVVQANNRLYGDSRIRGPYKESFKRDVVRVRGGRHDYFVMDKIHVHDLRKYQSQPVPADGESARFKPYPVGYSISSRRRI